MKTRCILCNEPISIRAIGAMMVTGNRERPDGEAVCRRCAALSPAERKTRRDHAMTRMLTGDDGSSEGGSR
jgi:hypothetical protein